MTKTNTHLSTSEHNSLSITGVESFSVLAQVLIIRAFFFAINEMITWKVSQSFLADLMHIVKGFDYTLTSLESLKCFVNSPIVRNTILITM